MSTGETQLVPAKPSSPLQVDFASTQPNFSAPSNEAPSALPMTAESEGVVGNGGENVGGMEGNEGLHEGEPVDGRLAGDVSETGQSEVVEVRLRMTCLPLAILYIQTALCIINAVLFVNGMMPFLPYSKILSAVMLRLGLFAAVFASLLFAIVVTALGFFRLFVIRTASEEQFGKFHVKAEAVAEGIAAGVLFAIGAILLAGSAFWRGPIQENIAFAIENSIQNSDVDTDLNRMQMQFACCGMAMKNVSQPADAWRGINLLDNAAFRAEEFRRFNFYPWSCCADESAELCANYAPKHLKVEFAETELNASSMSRTLPGSLSKVDCAVAFHRSMQFVFFYPVGGVFIAIGLCMAAVAVASLRIYLSFGKAHSEEPPPIGTLQTLPQSGTGQEVSLPPAHFQPDGLVPLSPEQQQQPYPSAPPYQPPPQPAEPSPSATPDTSPQPWAHPPLPA